MLCSLCAYCQAGVADRLQEQLYSKKLSLREFFLKADQHRRSKLTHDNFRAALREWGVLEGLSKTEIESLVEDVDADGDGFIEYPEFLARFDLAFVGEEEGAALDARLAELARTLYDRRGPALKAFGEADTNKNGVLEYSEFTSALLSLGCGVTSGEALALAKRADTNSDGFVNFNEFAASFRVTNTRALLKFGACGGSASDIGDFVYSKRDHLLGLFYQADEAKIGLLALDRAKELLDPLGKELTPAVWAAVWSTVTAFVASEDSEEGLDYAGWVGCFAPASVGLPPGGRAAALRVVANALHAKHLRLMDFFKQLDKDRSGTVSWEEFRGALVRLKLGISLADIRGIFDSTDIGGDGELNYEEFMSRFFVVDKRKVKVLLGIIREPMRAKHGSAAAFFDAAVAGTANGKTLSPLEWKAAVLALDGVIEKLRNPVDNAYTLFKLANISDEDELSKYETVLLIDGKEAADEFRTVEMETMKSFGSRLLGARMSAKATDAVVEAEAEEVEIAAPASKAAEAEVAAETATEPEAAGTEGPPEAPPEAEKAPVEAPAEAELPMDEATAATKIASGYRGMKARQEVRSRRETAAEQRVAAEAAAGAVITRHARGYQARRRVAEMRAAQGGAKSVDQQCVVAAARARDFFRALGQRLGSSADGRPKERPSSSRKGAEALHALAAAAAIRERWAPAEAWAFIEATTRLSQYDRCFTLNLVNGRRLCKLRMMHLTQMGIRMHDHQRIIMAAIHEAQSIASQTAILEALDAAGEEDAAPFLGLVTGEDDVP